MVGPDTATRSEPTTAVVVGASGGLGAAFVDALVARGGHDVVLALSRTGYADAPAPVQGDRAALGPPTVLRAHIDLTAPESIAAAASIARSLPPVRCVIVATGLLHSADGLRPEKSMAALDATRLARLFAVNATGPALVARHFMPLMPREGRVVFAALSARVGSISDNRLGGWYGYRASKAALNMLLKTLAIEWARSARDAVCVGLHPGTVDTMLSAPFQGNVADGRLFTAARSAACLLDVLAGLDAADSGRVFAWDGSEVPA
jgi:NAD(P)-dependent dehydrogenase (short-subunit alcohol dehydrogenase family)